MENTGIREVNNNNVTILDVLIDAAASLQNSEFRADYTLQGNFALTTLLYDHNLRQYERLTRDLDLDYLSKDSWERFVNKCEGILEANSGLGLKYKLIGRRGFDKTKNENGDSLAFKALSKSGEEFGFKIDMNIKPLSPKTTYRIFQFTIEATELLPLFINKLSSLTTIRVCRRIKDFYDIFVISHIQDFSMADILDGWYAAGKALPEDGIFILAPSSIEKLRHAYDAFYGIINKPVFNELYINVLDFTAPIFECLYRDRNNVKWISAERRWEICG